MTPQGVGMSPIPNRTQMNNSFQTQMAYWHPGSGPVYKTMKYKPRHADTDNCVHRVRSTEAALPQEPSIVAVPQRSDNM